MENLTFNTWAEAEDYLYQNSSVPCSLRMLDHAASGKFSPDAFSLGQLVSKNWLLYEVPILRGEVVILGCWYATIVDMLLHSHMGIDRIWGFDKDPETIALSEILNNCYVRDEWQYKGVVADVDILTFSALEFETVGELINIKPSVIINTSCEHMSDDWYKTVASDQLVVLQTNDNPTLDGHINTCATIEEMKVKYPMREVKYAGTLKTPSYRRHMLIGYPQ